MNRVMMKLRAIVLRTGVGKKLRSMKQKRSYSEEIAIDMVNSAYPDLSAEEKAALVKDMLEEGKKYNVGFDEYVMYHFEKRSQEERRLFIPTRERALYCERLNDPKNQMIFDDKGKTFEVFHKYYKRDLAEVVGWTKESTDCLRAFVEKHPRFIIKPFNGGNGRGIQIVDRNQYDSFDSFCAFLKKSYTEGFVAEELIKQCKELSAVHPESVNTLRIFTILFDDRVEFLPLAWRVGRGSACVDNGGSGGIFCALDDDGVIIATADEKGRSYEVHPDTKHPLVGFRVPRIEEAKELAKELAGEQCSLPSDADNHNVIRLHLHTSLCFIKRVE